MTGRVEDSAQVAAAARTLLAVLLCAALACDRPGGAGGPPPPSPADAAPSLGPAAGTPSLLLVTVDTWRWDYIGVSGAGKVATPNLDRLAREGVYEPEAETPCPLTTPAHATILTGLLPLRHRVLDCVGYVLSTSVPTLAEGFRDRGYATAAFVSSLSLDRRYGLDRGFLTYDEGAMGGAGANSRDGEETTSAALEFLRLQKPREPLFLWVHYFDLHLPYRPRPAYDARYPGSPYAAQAAFVDDQVGRLVGALGADRSRTWRVAVVGDHGEGLGDHHEMGHGMALYRSTLHVPLLLWPKPERPLRHPAPWRLEDLDATLGSWLGLPPPGRTDGADLFAPGPADRPLSSLTIQPSVQFAVNPCLGLRRGRWMYLRHGLEELYDLAEDPGETRDLAAEPARRGDLAKLRAECGAAIPPAALREAAAPTARLTAADLRGLQGLGYVGGLTFNPAELQRADIRQVCDSEASLERAKEAYRSTRAPGPMRAAYEALLGRYPRASGYFREYGEFLLHGGDTEGAFKAFDRAVRLNPADGASLVNLAGLTLAKGQPDKARLLFESALAANEADPVSHKNLGIIYSQYLKDPAKAVAHYKRYLELGGDADAALVRDYIRSVEAPR